LIRQRRVSEAAAYIRDVHWSFAVQKKYIALYYQSTAKPGTQPED
jgi:hypothetical protein